MKINYLILFLSIAWIQISFAQEDKSETMEKLPFHQIPDFPEEYNSCTVVARMIDGLGYRYYWATEGLRAEDLEYRPTPESRSVNETLNHLYGLSEVIMNGAKNEANIRPLPELDFSFEEKRKRTLHFLKEASDIMRKMDPAEIEKLMVSFKRGENQSDFPFWHQLNGPLADALWHTGQVVAFRRASGNPLPLGVNVFMGKTKSNE